MTQLLKKQELQAWLNQFDITEYRVVNEGNHETEYEVEFDESVNFNNNPIHFFPFRIGTVHGNFKATNCQLNSLENGPKVVLGNFTVNNNNLSSLKDSPLKIIGSFNFNDNKITNFDYAPQKVKRIKCLNNPITQFKNHDFKIGRSFEIDFSSLFLSDFTKLSLNSDVDIIVSVNEKEFQYLRDESNKKYHQTQDFVGEKTIIEDTFSNFKSLVEKIKLDKTINTSDKSSTKIKL